MQTVSTELFKSNVAFTLTLSRWGNTRKLRSGTSDFPPYASPDVQQQEEALVDKSKAALKGRIKRSKVLIVADEYDAIVSHQGETRKRCEMMSVPSFFKKGFMLIRTSGIEKLEKYLKSRVAEQEELVRKLAQVWPDKIRQSAADLGEYWDAKDYPSIPALISKFAIRWNWIAFGIPDQLPREIFEAEKEKAEKVWLEATDQITLALREGFKKLVDNAVERLTVEPGQEKKTFRDSLVGNIVEFLDLFGDRNITCDTELELLVNKAKEVVSGLSPDDLRKNDDMREQIAMKFSELSQNLDTMIEQMPSRRFSFDESEEA